MSVTVSGQAYIFLCTVIGGMLATFIYDIFRIKRRAIKTGTIITNIEDFIYWIIVALVIFGVVYYSNEGEIRGYVFIGSLFGMILYMLLFSRIVISSSMFIIGVVYRLILFIWKVISFPFKIVFKILEFPARLLKRIILKIVKNAGRKGKSGVKRTLLFTKRFKNIRKKI